MTPQEIFDTAARGIIAQGGASVLPGGECQYRGPNGRKCAAGHLLPDKRYDPYHEGGCAASVPFFKGHPHIRLIAAMQKAHDESVLNPDRADDDGCLETDEGFLEAWAEKMRSIAYRFELNTEALVTEPVEP